MPRFRRSVEVREPVYVGRISRPISSMIANSWAYLVRPLFCALFWLAAASRLEFEVMAVVMLDEWVLVKIRGEVDCGYLRSDGVEPPPPPFEVMLTLWFVFGMGVMDSCEANCDDKIDRGVSGISWRQGNGG